MFDLRTSRSGVLAPLQAAYARNTDGPRNQEAPAEESAERGVADGAVAW